LEAGTQAELVTLRDLGALRHRLTTIPDRRVSAAVRMPAVSAGVDVTLLM
jgi:hypothetical protein